MNGKLQFIQVLQGVYWVEIRDLELKILCSCPPDVVKHLMLKGLIKDVSENDINFETGPNIILLSDIMLQNGQFSNMAEFPVLQMLYKQGMIIPGHPNNDGAKPLLIGSKEQIDAQLAYIYRGNYGLTSYEEVLESVKDEKLAKDLWRMKKRFAFGEIKPTEELIDTLILENEQLAITQGLTLERVDTNVFEFQFEGESLTIDINLPADTTYSVPYPLGFHDIKREYFSIVHSGQGDGFDVNRPSMSSIITFQGKVYIIDAGPNIAYSLMTLGFGINEIEGIFQTHAHDDHFAGITTLLRADHRIKFYATPMVRSSVFKKLAALLGKDSDDFSHFFDVQDIEMNEWSDIHGLEVRPVMSPHPVETTIFFFRTYWGSEYYSYAHFADIASIEVLKEMITENDDELGISQELFDAVTQEYATEVNLKKIDIGGGMIHGDAEDFSNDPSQRVILAHTAAPLSTRQKEIGSSAPFGIVDLMIPEFTNILHRKASTYLQNYFTSASEAQLEKLLNNAIILYPPGSLILRKGENNNNVYLVLTGYIEKMTPHINAYNLLSAGSFIGEYSGLRGIESVSTFRSVSYVQTLQIPTKSYKEFIKKNRLFRRIEKIKENIDFLEKHLLFRESIGSSTLEQIASKMHQTHYFHVNEEVKELSKNKLYLINHGKIEINYIDNEPETSLPVTTQTLSNNDFFLFEELIDKKAANIQLKIIEPSSLFEIDHDVLKSIPIILWKLIEIYKKDKVNAITHLAD